MHGDGMGTKITVQKSARNGIARGWGWNVQGQKGTGTGLVGWGWR